MRILRLGVTGPDATPVFEGIDEADFAGQVAASSRKTVASSADELRTAFEHPPVFGEIQPTRPVDQTNPREAGWTFLVAKDDPRRADWETALEPLAAHRGMHGDPLTYPGGDPVDWLDEEYLGRPDGTRPRYVLLAGDPERLPFRLQVHLAAVGAAVGRVDFDTPAELASYVEKVLRLETAADPVPGAEALLFATDGGPRDPTYYSRRYMAEPLRDQVAARPPFQPTLIAGNDASKDHLLTALTTTKPALVYTASHGYEVRHGPTSLAEQKRLNGAIACARRASLEDMLLTASDVPGDDTAVAEGSVFFQFACWGYGTPRRSTFDHWQLGGSGTATADEDFVAALPKRLLGHPRGPVAFVGHVDTAWLHGFDDPANPLPELGALYHPRLEPFRTALDEALLERRPAGYALSDLAYRTALLSVNLADFFDGLQARGRAVADITTAERRALADSFIRRNDAMFFLLLGDPAARARVGTPD